MRQVLTLRKTLLVFGFALAAFGCDMNKDQLHNANNGVLAVQYSSNANKEVLAAEYSYSVNGELLAKSEYEHDSNGNMIKFSSYDANGELPGYSELERDSKGNTTKASHYHANGDFYITEIE